MFSRACQYSFQAVLYIALHQQGSKLIGLKEIAAAQDIPQHFLSKILQNLVKSKILTSTKGSTGGFALYIPSDKLTLLEVVKVVDGLDIFDRCGIGLKFCSDVAPCPIHQDFKIVKNKIRSLLGEKTLADLCMDVEAGKSIVTYIQKT